MTTENLAVQTTKTTPPDVQEPDENTALLVSAEKLAQLLDISIRTLWRLRAAGKLPAPVRLGGSVRWRLDGIQAWIDRGCPEEVRVRVASQRR